MARFERMFGEWVVRNRWWMILVTALLVSVAAAGMGHLTINNDTRVFFSDKNPQLKALEALENTYTRDTNVLFVVAPKDGDVFRRRTLMAVTALTEASWKMPYSSRVDSITNFQHTRVAEDDLIVEDLVQDAEGTSDGDLERIRNIALSEPLLVSNLISAKGHVTAVLVTLNLPGKSMTEVPEVARFSRKLVDEIAGAYPNLNLYLNGSVMMDNAFGEASQKDMSTLIPGMFLILVAIVGIAMRSFWGTLCTLVVVAFSTITAMGVAGWIGLSITPASINAPTLILTLAVADSVHFLATMVGQRRSGKSKRDAIAESLRINLQPIFLTSITTAIGFLTMNFSDAPPFRDLGNIVAVGVMAALVYSTLLLPSLMAVLPSRTVRRRPDTGAADSRGLEWLADLVIRRRKAMLWGTLGVFVVLTAGTLNIALNDNFYEYFDERYEVRRSTDFILEHLRGLDAIEYSLESGEAGGIHNPEFLRTTAAFADWYLKQPKVVHVNTITDRMKRLNQVMHADDSSYYRIPHQRDLAAQYLLLYEMSLPFGLDLNNQINVDKSATRMIVTLKNASTTEMREMDAAGREWLKTNAPGSMHTLGTGLSIVWAHISERNIKSMLGATFWALVLISGILTVSLKDFKIGLISLIPNLAPVFMAFGVWGLVKGEIGLALSIILSMTIGIVVDDTVHFLSKYLRARKEHRMDVADAVRYSFSTVGKAMWITTLALVAGFTVLTFSGYKMSADMGLMSAITISIALVMDFLFLPVLLMKVDGRTATARERRYPTFQQPPLAVEGGPTQ